MFVCVAQKGHHIYVSFIGCNGYCLRSLFLDFGPINFRTKPMCREPEGLATPKRLDPKKKKRNKQKS